MAARIDSFATESGHWYRPDGSAAYEVVGKNGKRRPATLRDARELGLLPSVTSIMKLEAKPQLENWKINQACLACLTLPRLPNEDEDSFIKRALVDSREQAKVAAARGTYLHGLLEKALDGSRAPDASPEDLSIVVPVMNWLTINFGGYAWHPERSFACSHGYGGKLDLHGSNGTHDVVLDFKVKADIVEGKQLAYDEHATQLAAYAHGIGAPDARCVNLFISSTVPGLIVPVEWDAADIRCGWQAFQCLLALWKCRRGIA